MPSQAPPPQLCSGLRKGKVSLPRLRGLDQSRVKPAQYQVLATRKASPNYRSWQDLPENTLLSFSLLLTFVLSSSVGPVHRLQVPAHGLKFLSMGLSSCQEKLLQCSFLRATVAVTRTCSSMSAIPVTCYGVCSTGHGCCQGSQLQHGQSMATVLVRKALHQRELSGATAALRKASYRTGSPQSVTPPGHIHWFQDGVPEEAQPGYI